MRPLVGELDVLRQNPPEAWGDFQALRLEALPRLRLVGTRVAAGEERREAITAVVRQGLAALAEPWSEAGLYTFRLHPESEHLRSDKGRKSIPQTAAGALFGHRSQWFGDTTRTWLTATERQQPSAAVSPCQHLLRQLEAALLALEAATSAAVDAAINARPAMELPRQLRGADDASSIWTTLPPLTLGGQAFCAAPDLVTEIQLVAENQFRTFRRLHVDGTFVSLTPPLKLRSRRYDPDDVVLVMALADGGEGVQEDSGGEPWNNYVDFLREHSGLGPDAANVQRTLDRNGINQIRATIIPNRDEEPPALRRIRQQLVHLHKKGSKLVDADRGEWDHGTGHLKGNVFTFPKSQLPAFGLLECIRFGGLVSTKHRYAMITVPPAAPFYKLNSENIQSFLRDDCPAYHASQGPMRSIVTTDEVFIDRFITEFLAMREHPHAARLEPLAPPLALELPSP